MMQAERLIDFIYVKYLKKRITYDHLVRVEDYQYPIEAVREAIYNALIHSDYSNFNDIQIKIMDDMLFIANNCIIDINEINNKNIFTMHKFVPLNPLLANAFYRAGFIEHWGRGIKRICDECKDYGIKKPIFEITPGGFSITFKAKFKYDYGTIKNNDVVSKKSSKNDYPITTPKDYPITTPKKNNELDKNVEKILNLIINNKNITAQEIANKIGMTRDGVRYHLNKLKNQRKIRHYGTVQNGYWEILK